MQTKMKLNKPTWQWKPWVNRVTVYLPAIMASNTRYHRHRFIQKRKLNPFLTQWLILQTVLKKRQQCVFMTLDDKAGASSELTSYISDTQPLHKSAFNSPCCSQVTGKEHSKKIRICNLLFKSKYQWVTYCTKTGLISCFLCGKSKAAKIATLSHWAEEAFVSGRFCY